MKKRIIIKLKDGQVKTIGYFDGLLNSELLSSK